MTHTQTTLHWLRTLFLNWLSALCGGEITAKDVLLAVAGGAAAVFLVVAWGFLIAIIYTPHF